jgi:membrane-bound lytic murein transglycosylase D
MRCPKTLAAIWLTLLLAAGPAVAQQKPAQSNAPVQSMQQWLNDNVDPDVLQSLNQIDLSGVQDFLTNLQHSFAGTNIYELGSLKEVAVKVLPVLDEYEETEPYAAWLRAHLDDFDAANEMQREMKAVSTNSAATTVLRAPTLKFQRSVWKRELAGKPWPPLAKAYVPKLKRIFLSEKVPPALIWVAGVESSFDPRARSPAGAAGMFQLMPATARREHLSLWPFDQRYQPEKSARAAAHYLRSLHEHYGDWPLALAAYNVGECRVDKLLKDHNANSFDAIARWLPAETRMYVPKVEATIFLREGVALADLKTPRA